MLLPFSVYCRRIKANTTSTKPSVCFKSPNKPQLVFTFLLHLLTSARSSVINIKSAKIFSFYFVLNFLFLPIMGTPLIEIRSKSTFAPDITASAVLGYALGQKSLNFYENINKKSRQVGQTERVDQVNNSKHKYCPMCKFLLHWKNISGRVTKDFLMKNSQERTLRTESTFPPRTIETESTSTSSGKLRLMSAISSTIMDSAFFNPTVRRRSRRNVGDRRLKRLYCRTGFILQIHANGRVDGTYDHRTKLGEMLIQTISKGLVRIQSQATGLFLAMTRSGKLYASATYVPERSSFAEKVEEGWYNTYSSWRPSNARRQRKAYVGLSKNGKPKKGTKISYASKSAHFLPLDVD